MESSAYSDILARNIQKELDKQGIDTPDGLEKLAVDLGVAVADLEAWKCGSEIPEYEMLDRLSGICRCDVTYLKRPPHQYGQDYTSFKLNPILPVMEEEPTLPGMRWSGNGEGNGVTEYTFSVSEFSNFILEFVTKSRTGRVGTRVIFTSDSMDA